MEALAKFKSKVDKNSFQFPRVSGSPYLNRAGLQSYTIGNSEDGKSKNRTFPCYQGNCFDTVK